MTSFDALMLMVTGGIIGLMVGALVARNHIEDYLLEARRLRKENRMLSARIRVLERGIK